jgi:hypothetical protein
MSLVELARFSTRVEAELARMHLDAAGFDAVLFDAEMNSFGFGPIMPVRLMVPDEDHADALRLLRENSPPPA